MSQILKSLLQPAIKQVLTDLAKPDMSSAAKDPTTAQNILAEQLASAIATAVQQYLQASVTTTPSVTITAPGPSDHIHSIPPIKLLAP